jgi:predicted transcriptional regulator of viral defense system
MAKVVGPSWDQLFEAAAAQEGLFTTKQAAGAGYSSQLLLKHVRARRIRRVRRGIYRLVHYPFGEHEALVVAWLWSEQAGVISHQTALSLHQLSDVLPAQVHMTLPGDWRHRRFRTPEGIVLHFADVPKSSRTWVGPVPVTTVPRTLNDCAHAALSPDLLGQGARQALQRGLATKAELADVTEALRPFGGIQA